MIASLPLAASGSSSLFLIMAGVVVAALLVSAFWYGSRRAATRKDPGAQPSEQSRAARARQDSWQTPDGPGTGPAAPRRP
ncbi:DUF6479 family protein [Streptomyces sp. NBC_01232]|uniref:DUF6479 family protein n=1 Tax=unclassified Streptomyces TaxID=2593676 RepID=UPI002E12BC57|nr:DUF6479 family protein [Streptomyces sp. NBC_01232]